MITLDTTGHGSSATSPITISYTNAGNLLVVGIVGGGTDIISNATFNGVSMTRGKEVNNGNSTSYIYYLLNPFIGTANVVVTMSVNTNTIVDIASFFGIKTVGQPTANGSHTASGVNNDAISLTTPDDKSIMLAVYATDSTVVSSVTNGTLNHVMAYSNPLLITPAGSFTMTGNASGNNAWADVALTFSPDTGGGSFIFNLI